VQDKEGLNSSLVQMGTGAIVSNTVAAPTFNPAGGATSSVTLSTTTAGASIRYTTDGSTLDQRNGLHGADCGDRRGHHPGDCVPGGMDEQQRGVGEFHFVNRWIGHIHLAGIGRSAEFPHPE
jgi:hypothetical protein